MRGDFSGTGKTEYVHNNVEAMKQGSELVA
jgi:hypothetical protein